MSRPRVLIVLGAGSTLHAGAPSTQDIDNLILGINDEPFRSVVNRLRNQRNSGNFNFETVLATLEELDVFHLRKNVPTAWPSIGGYLSAFVDYQTGFPPITGSSFRSAHSQLIGRIKDFVIDRTRNASADRLKSFFDCLRSVFDLTVITLNYDDLVDQTDNWYDGFRESGKPTTYRTFDFSGFPHQSMHHPAVLMHLHGSVRFTFPPFSFEPPREGAIVRSDRPVRGLHSMLHPPEGITQPSPIIAGDGKDHWMTRACVPFGYYYNAFINTIQTCPRLLVAGYGGGDRHVNSWLNEEYTRLHGDRRRIVHINPSLLEIQDVPECLNLRGDDGYFPPENRDQVGTIIDFLNST